MLHTDSYHFSKLQLIYETGKKRQLGPNFTRVTKAAQKS